MFCFRLIKIKIIVMRANKPIHEIWVINEGKTVWLKLPQLRVALSPMLSNNKCSSAVFLPKILHSKSGRIGEAYIIK